MIVITPQAAAEILKAAIRSDAEGMYLRVAAQFANNGAIAYGMGFDEIRDGDVTDESEGITVIMNYRHRPLLCGVVLDFITLHSGDAHFVFANPNDSGCAAFLGVCGGCKEKCRQARATPVVGSYGVEQGWQEARYL